jgi:hypothetical protein
MSALIRFIQSRMSARLPISASLGAGVELVLVATWCSLFSATAIAVRMARGGR